MNLPLPDLLILLGYMLAVMCFGLWSGRRQKDLADYTVGSRNLPWWAILFSIVATETSTVTFLSIPGWAYAHDLSWLQLPLGFVLGRLVVVLLLLPHYFRGQLYTAYEVLERQFGGAVKQVASALFIVTRSLADGLRLFLSAIVLYKVADLDLGLCILLVGVLTIVYTFLGGMRAVVWTDCVQFFVYMAGAAIAFEVLLAKMPGGLDQVLEMAAAENKLKIFDFSFAYDDAHVFWAGLIGGGVFSLGTHGADQMMVQRYLCARSRSQAGLALLSSGPVVVLQIAFFLILGLGLFAFYKLHHPGLTFENNDHVFATFIVKELPVGVTGIVLGAVFSAAMSTLSSSLNSSATALVNDIYVPLLRPEASGGQKLDAIRIFTIFFGAVQICVGIAGQWLEGSVVDAVLSIAGFTTGIILGIFFLGILTRRVGSLAALMALVLGLGLMTWIKFATALAWPWYAAVGSISTFLIGLFASLFFPARQASTQP